MTSQTFQQDVQSSSGEFAEYWLWSNYQNWMDSIVPSAGSDTTIPAIIPGSLGGLDNLPNLSLNSLTLQDGAILTVASTLTVADLSLTNTSEVIVETDLSGNPATFTIGVISGSGEILATGAGAVVIDDAPADPGEAFVAIQGGVVEITANPSSGSVFDYGGDPHSQVHLPLPIRPVPSPRIWPTSDQVPSSKCREHRLPA